MEIMVKDVAAIYCAIKKHPPMKKHNLLLLLNNTGENDISEKKVQVISEMGAEMLLIWRSLCFFYQAQIYPI